MPLIEASGNALNIDLPSHQIMLDVDATRIAQVIGNVLGNAAKYTPAGGHIEIAAREEGDTVRISVTDNGIGIPAESAHMVFNMFSQVGTSIERAQGGLGIGLSLARRLVELHGGSIALASRPGAVGSTFEIRLPLAAPAPLAAQAEPPDSAEAAPRALRVLVVDDNIDAADMLAALIEMNGHAIRVANDGEQALLIAADFLPEVAFLDIGMPGMNGYQLSEKLGGMPQLAGLARVALTGWGDENARARSREAGFDYHLLKPCTMSVVETLLQEVGRRVPANG